MQGVGCRVSDFGFRGFGFRFRVPMEERPRAPRRDLPARGTPCVAIKVCSSLKRACVWVGVGVSEWVSE